MLVRARVLNPADGEPGWPYPRPGGAGLEAGDAHEVVLRPYHSWGNRGPTTMRVWLPTAG